MLNRACFFGAVIGLVLGMKTTVWSQYQIVTVQNSGTITGQVVFSGEAPAPKQIQITKDARICGQVAHYDESLVVSSDNGGLKNVVVSIMNISGGKSWPADPDLPVFDQNGCRFDPHVIVVPENRKFNILNSDGILHNIHTQSETNIAINRAQPKFLKKLSLAFEQAEFIKVSCDVHNWMQGWIVVAAHPYYAVTADNGSFAITDVPAGTYQLEFWHEKLGKQTREVTVTDGGKTELDLQFSLK